MSSAEWRRTYLLRLSGLPRWPKAEARTALQEATDAFATDATFQHFVDDWGHNVSDRAHTPADLYTAAGLLVSQPPADPDFCPIGECDGTGWIFIVTAKGEGVKACGCRGAT